MKRILIIVALAMSVICSASAQGKFIPVKERAARSSQVFKTEYTYGQGTQDTIYLSSTGHAFVNKTSKTTGKRYRKYLDEATSRQLCKEYGKTYTEKKSNK